MDNPPSLDRLEKGSSVADLKDHGENLLDVDMETRISSNEEVQKAPKQSLKRSHESSYSKQEDGEEGGAASNKKARLGEEGPPTNEIAHAHKNLLKLAIESREEHRIDDPFNFWSFLLARHDLVLELAQHLDFASLFNLFCISKDAYVAICNNMAAVIRHHAWTNAPESADIFHFKCYSDLCRVDPDRRINTELPGLPRCVPGFRWLKFIYFREDTVTSIVLAMARAGHRLPEGSPRVLKQIWFLMDLPDNARRGGMLHNQNFWSDLQLYIACLFFVKVDMRLNDPMNSMASLLPRQMLLAQRSLSVLNRVLRRQALRKPADVLRMLAEYQFEPSDDPAKRDLSVFGVPPHHLGRLQCEGWVQGNAKLIPVYDLVVMEMMRRGYLVQDYLIDMVIFGNVDADTGKDIPAFEGGEGGEEDKDYDSGEEFFNGLEERVKRMKLRSTGDGGSSRRAQAED